MKRVPLKKSIAAICLTAFLASAGMMEAYAGTGLGAAAAGRGIRYTADLSGTVDLEGRDLTINAGKNRDLFSNMKNLMPGATVSNTVKINNNSSNAVTFYLKAYSDYKAGGTGAVRTDGGSTETVTAAEKVFKEDLLDRIRMSIWSDSELIYQGTAAGEGSLTEDSYGISLGSVGAGSNKTLKVEITLPG